jgi:pilus assembly protein Flp/PilA
MTGPRGAPYGAAAADWGVKATTMINSVLPAFMTFLRDEEGASLVEYILLVALVAVVCIAAITLLGKSASKQFGSTANAINTAGS